VAKKSKDESELEYLRGMNRQLKKQLKKVTRQAGRAVKEVNKQLLEDQEDVEVELEEVETNKTEKCPQCGLRASLISLGVREVIVCDKCKFRKSRKANVKKE
jgi:hypothetical protein